MNIKILIRQLLIPFVFLFLASIQNSYSQNPEWINYTYNEDIQSIVGKDNILWLATSGGLVKFNTTTEEKEYFNVSNSGLRSNHVSPLAMDSLGNIWMWKSNERALSFPNESDNYLVKFDGEVWSYIPCTLCTSQPFGLNPSLIEIDNNNNVWIGIGSSGLFKFDGNSWSLFDTTNSNIPTNSINDIAIDNNNNLWLSSYEHNGLIMFDNTEWFVFDSSNSGCPNDIILNVEVDNTGKLWLTTINNIFTFEDNSCETISTIKPDPHILGGELKLDINNEPWLLDNHLYHLSSSGWKTYPLEPHQINYYTSAFFIDNSNNKWMNSKKETKEGFKDYYKGGLAKFDSTNWSVFNLSNSKFKGRGVGEIFKDSEKKIWLGSEVLTEIDGNIWTYHSPKYQSSPITNIISINEDSYGNMWFGNSSDGILKFDGTNWTTFNTDNSAISYKPVCDIAFDKEGSVWFTTYGELGVVKFDGNTFTVYDTTNSGLPENDIRTIENDSFGNLWFGSSNKGLVKYDFNNWTIYDTQIKWNTITGLLIDDEDCVWIGGSGLTSFKDGVWSYYAHDDSLEYYLNSITHITKDLDNNIWAVARYGLYKFDGNNWQKFDYTNSGLPNHFLGDIEFDKDGNLWIGTRSGVIVYKEGGVVTKVEDPKSQIVINNFELSQNYPNPFNPRTVIKYQIPNNKSQINSNSQKVTLKVYDILGREVATLVNQKQNPGNYKITWEASDQPSGVYFYKLTVNNLVQVRKMLLLK